MNRRQSFFAISIPGLHLLQACNFMDTTTQKSLIQLRMDATVSEVQAHSSFKFSKGFLQGIPGSEFIIEPHILVYRDDSLALRIEDAGGLPSLPTSIGYSARSELSDPESIIKYLSVHLLPKHSPLPVAVERARALRDMLLEQGFVLEVRSWKDRFNNANWEAVPDKLDAFEDLEPAFLNSLFFAKSATVFAYEKGRLLLELRLTNARRRWGRRTDNMDDLYKPDEIRGAEEAASMGRQELLTEPVYSLELSIGPTNEWMDQRADLMEAEYKKRKAKKSQ